MDAIFSLFFKKKPLLSCPFFVKNVHSLKNLPLSCLYFVEKTSILFKTRCFMSLASNVSWKPPAFVPIFGQNASILPKLHYIMGYKSIRYPFFRFSTKKSTLSCTYFVKNVNSQKTQRSHAHILSKKRPFSLKHCALMSFIFWKPRGAMPIFGPKKRQFC